VTDARERAYRVVYDEAIRALDLQRAAFDSLRTRVGFLLSAAAIATSFLGGLALRTGSDVGAWIGIALFAIFGGVIPYRDPAADRRSGDMGRRLGGASGRMTMSKSKPSPIRPNPMRPFPGDTQSGPKK